MDYQKLLNSIHQQVLPLYGQGRVADYIPELKQVYPQQFGMSICLLENNQHYNTGLAETPFSIQSISKVLALMLAMRCLGEKLWQRIKVEPSGDPFNSLVQLEYEKGIPRNPFINAGAIVISDVLVSHYEQPLDELLKFTRLLCNNPSIEIDEAVAHSEKQTGHRNYAMAHFLKSFGRINNPVDKVLNMYFQQCALALCCQDLCHSFKALANQGRLTDAPDNEAPILTSRQVKRVNALMQTCGFYDQAGEFTFRVGLPGKSGVGGGIGAVLPRHLSIAVWSPELNAFGNSVLGMKALEIFTNETNLSIF